MTASATFRPMNAPFTWVLKKHHESGWPRCSNFIPVLLFVRFVFGYITRAPLGAILVLLADLLPLFTRRSLQFLVATHLC